MKVLLSPAKAIDINKKIDTNIRTTPQFIEDAKGLVKNTDILYM